MKNSTFGVFVIIILISIGVLCGVQIFKKQREINKATTIKSNNFFYQAKYYKITDSTVEFTTIKNKKFTIVNPVNVVIENKP